MALNKHHILLHYKGRLSHLLIPFPNFDKFFLENITQKMFLHLWVSCLLCHSDLQHKHTLSRTIQRTFIPSFVPAWARCIRYTIMRQSLSVTCDRSVVFSGHSGFLQQTDCHNITEILLNVVLNTITLTQVWFQLDQWFQRIKFKFKSLWTAKKDTK